MSKQSYFKQFSFAKVHSLVLFDRTLSGATTPGQSGPQSDVNEGVLNNPKSSGVTGTSPLDCLVSYPGHSLGEVYPSSEKQLVYSTASSNLAIEEGVVDWELSCWIWILSFRFQLWWRVGYSSQYCQRWFLFVVLFFYSDWFELFFCGWHKIFRDQVGSIFNLWLLYF